MLLIVFILLVTLAVGIYASYLLFGTFRSYADRELGCGHGLWYEVDGKAMRDDQMYEKAVLLYGHSLILTNSKAAAVLRQHHHTVKLIDPPPWEVSNAE